LNRGYAVRSIDATICALTSPQSGMNERYRSRADTRCAGELRIVFTRESTSEIPGVDGHQDLPSDGHEVDAMAITESDRIRWSSRREPAPNADSAREANSLGCCSRACRSAILARRDPFRSWSG
jgi:hypothetical protein